MATTVPSGQYQELSSSNLQHERCKNCRLNFMNGTGFRDCVMDSVKCLWSNNSTSCYCDEPFSRKFVDFINAKREELKENQPSRLDHISQFRSMHTP